MASVQFGTTPSQVFMKHLQSSVESYHMKPCRIYLFQFVMRQYFRRNYPCIPHTPRLPQSKCLPGRLLSYCWRKFLPNSACWGRSLYPAVNHSRLVGGGSNGSPRQSTRGYEPGSRLILLEELIPETPDLVPGKWIDLLMLAITGGSRADGKRM